jgi:hypothetical protein
MATPAPVRPVAVPRPLLTDTTGLPSGASGSGVFGSLDDVLRDISSLFSGMPGGTGANSTAPSGFAAAVLAAILVFGAGLLLLRQWSRGIGLPESPPSYVLVPPG